MPNHSMTREEIDRYRRYRVGVNEAIIKDAKDNERYRRMALKNKWVKVIKALNSKGYTSQEIYETLGAKMKKELGYDPLKTIEHFCKKTYREQNQDDLER